MSHLNKREQELVAIGAAVGSNCVPCVVFHVREARSRGLTVDEIRESISVAEEVKQMPAELVRKSALAQLEGDNVADDEPCDGGGAPAPDAAPCCS